MARRYHPVLDDNDVPFNTAGSHNRDLTGTRTWAPAWNFADREWIEAYFRRFSIATEGRTFSSSSSPTF